MDTNKIWIHTNIICIQVSYEYKNNMDTSINCIYVCVVDYTRIIWKMPQE